MAENDDARATETESRWNVVTQFLPATVAALVLVVSLVVGIRAPAASIKQLTVVGSLVPAGDHWEISGRVLQDGDGSSS